MYNGIGLQTARGSGTNGYVQRNFAFVRKGKDDIKYKTEEDIKRLEASTNREPNQGILDHERKRKLEVKCMELEDDLEEQGVDPKTIREKVAAFRESLMNQEVSKKAFADVDEFGRPVAKETHQIAEAQREKNNRLKEAFGIRDNFVEGSSFDRRAAEEAAKIASKKYDMVPMEEEPTPTERKKKKRDQSSSSSSSSSDSESDTNMKKTSRNRRQKTKSPSISREKDRLEAEKLTFPKIKDERDNPPIAIRWSTNPSIRGPLAGERITKPVYVERPNDDDFEEFRGEGRIVEESPHNLSSWKERQNGDGDRRRRSHSDSRRDDNDVSGHRNGSFNKKNLAADVKVERRSSRSPSTEYYEKDGRSGRRKGIKRNKRHGSNSDSDTRRSVSRSRGGRTHGHSSADSVEKRTRSVDDDSEKSLSRSRNSKDPIRGDIEYPDRRTKARKRAATSSEEEANAPKNQSRRSAGNSKITRNQSSDSEDTDKERTVQKYREKEERLNQAKLKMHRRRNDSTDEDRNKKTKKQSRISKDYRSSSAQSEDMSEKRKKKKVKKSKRDDIDDRIRNDHSENSDDPRSDENEKLRKKLSVDSKRNKSPDKDSNNEDHNSKVREKIKTLKRVEKLLQQELEARRKKREREGSSGADSLAEESSVKRAQSGSRSSVEPETRKALKKETSSSPRKSVQEKASRGKTRASPPSSYKRHRDSSSDSDDATKGLVSRDIGRGRKRYQSPSTDSDNSSSDGKKNAAPRSNRRDQSSNDNRAKKSAAKGSRRNRSSSTSSSSHGSPDRNRRKSGKSKSHREPIRSRRDSSSSDEKGHSRETKKSRRSHSFDMDEVD